MVALTSINIIASDICSSLSYSLSYNATILVTLLFSYRALVGYHGVADEIAEEVESTLIL